MFLNNKTVNFLSDKISILVEENDGFGEKIHILVSFLKLFTCL